jgi:hypothetical protein
MVFRCVLAALSILSALQLCAGKGEAVRYRLFDTKAAMDDKTGWEWQSYPLGCGYLGGTYLAFQKMNAYR